MSLQGGIGSSQLTILAVELLEVDSSAVPQPFVDPSIFNKWRGKS